MESLSYLSHRLNREDVEISWSDAFERKATYLYCRFIDSGRWVDIEVSRSTIEKIPEPHSFRGWNRE